MTSSFWITRAAAAVAFPLLCAGGPCSPELGFDRVEIAENASVSIRSGRLQYRLMDAYLTVQGGGCTLERIDFVHVTIGGMPAFVESIQSALALEPEKKTPAGQDGVLAVEVHLPLLATPPRATDLLGVTRGKPRVEAFLRLKAAGQTWFHGPVVSNEVAPRREVSLSDLSSIMRGALSALDTRDLHGVTWRTAQRLLVVSGNQDHRLAYLGAGNAALGLPPGESKATYRAHLANRSQPGESPLPATSPALNREGDAWRWSGPAPTAAITSPASIESGIGRPAAFFRVFVDRDGKRSFLTARVANIRKAQGAGGEFLEIYPALDEASEGSPILVEEGIAGFVESPGRGRIEKLASQPPATPAKPATPAAAQYVMRLETKPAGAQVWIDGQAQAARTDGDFPVSVGRHEVRLVLDGYKEQTFQADLTRGHRRYAVDLIAAPAAALIAITITSTPPNAQIFVDNKPAGSARTPASMQLKPGSVVKVFDDQGSQAVLECPVPEKGNALVFRLAEGRCEVRTAAAPARAPAKAAKRTK